MYRSVLVPLDGSTCSEQALALAAHVAGRAGAALSVASVHSPFQYYRASTAVAPAIDEEARQQRQAYLADAVQRLTASAGLTVTSTLLIGHPADALYDHAVAQKVDLVVMTTQGRGPLSRFWLGSVANDLMRRLPMPVLLVRAQESAAAGGAAPALQRILLPLDGSELAEQIVEPAVAMGALTQAEFTLLGVIDPILEFDDVVPARKASGFSPAVRAEVSAARDRQQTAAESYLTGVASRLEARALRVQVRVVQNVNPAAAILEAARQDIDLITLATHGRRGLARLVLGSVADKVVRGATTPVLVFRPQGK